MKRLFSAVLAMTAAVSITTSAETIKINDVDYQTDVLIERDLGPGVHYTRLRIPDYP